jgi:hypothetical protein
MTVMTRRRLIIAAIVIAIPALAIGWWLGSPLFLDTEVSEEFPMSVSAIVPDDMTQEEVEAEMEDAAAAPDVETTDDMMPEDSGPVAFSAGEFKDFDSFHMGSGTATIYQLEDGAHVLRLEGFEVTNGPDLHVLLVPADDPGDRDAIDGYVDLGSLKGNIGDQNYEIPADVDVSEFGSVVIYCQPFHVIFSVASLG